MKRSTTILLIAIQSLYSWSATYTVDPAHTHIGFAVSHLGISETRGFFREFEGTVEYEPDNPESFRLRGSIKAASVDTAIEARDHHLRGPDFFDTASYPEITFVSERAEYDGSRLLVTGPFTMKGVTKTLTIPITVSGPVKDMFGKTRIGLSARLVLNRHDFGISWSQTLDTGALVIGDDVTVSIEAEAILNE